MHRKDFAARGAQTPAAGPAGRFGYCSAPVRCPVRFRGYWGLAGLAQGHWPRLSQAGNLRTEVLGAVGGVIGGRPVQHKLSVARVFVEVEL